MNSLLRIHARCWTYWRAGLVILNELLNWIGEPNERSSTLSIRGAKNIDEIADSQREAGSLTCSVFLCIQRHLDASSAIERPQVVYRVRSVTPASDPFLALADCTLRCSNSKKASRAFNNKCLHTWTSSASLLSFNLAEQATWVIARGCCLEITNDWAAPAEEVDFPRYQLTIARRRFLNAGIARRSFRRGPDAVR